MRLHFPPGRRSSGSSRSPQTKDRFCTERNVGTVRQSLVLDKVTELKPNLRKLPFDEFVQMMTRPMVGTQALEEELRSTFPTFSDGKANITPTTLAAGLARLGRPVEPLMAEEMVAEARGDDPHGAGKISLSEFCASLSVGPPRGAGGTKKLMSTTAEPLM